MTTPEEDFEKAFDEVTGHDTPPVADDSAEEVPPEGSETPDDSAPEDTESEATETPTAEETDYEALYQKELQRTKSWEGRIRAANARAEEAERRLVSTPAAPPPETAEVADEELTSFFAEYPELEKPFIKLVQVKGEKIARTIVQEEIQKITPAIQQIQSQVQKSNVEQHFEKLQGAHPDYLTVAQSAEFSGWMEAQPAFLRPRYQQVVSEGTADEAIELLDLYKEQIKPTPGDHQKRVKSKAAKADALAAVPASSGGPPASGPDPDDYDTAWDEITR